MLVFVQMLKGYVYISLLNTHCLFPGYSTKWCRDQDRPSTFRFRSFAAVKVFKQLRMSCDCHVTHVTLLDKLYIIERVFIRSK